MNTCIQPAWWSWKLPKGLVSRPAVGTVMPKNYNGKSCLGKNGIEYIQSLPTTSRFLCICFNFSTKIPQNHNFEVRIWCSSTYQKWFLPRNPNQFDHGSPSPTATSRQSDQVEIVPEASRLPALQCHRKAHGANTWRIISRLGSVVDNHGDRPVRIGLWDPFQMAFLWLLKGGDLNHWN